MKRLNALTFKQLRALEAVASSGSMTHSADELGLTAPAVHSQIKTLEANFGCSLLTRSSTEGFAPTPEGTVLLRAYQRAQAGFETAIKQINALHDGLAGSVTLGVGSTGKYFAPALVAHLGQKYPDIEIAMAVGNRQMLVEHLENRSIDMAIMGRPPRFPHVEAVAIGDHPHIIIAPPNHRLAEACNINPDELSKERWIYREEGSGTRVLATRFLDRIANRPAPHSTEISSNETIKQAVIAGLGIALISYHTVVEEIRSGRLIALDFVGLPIVRQWFLVHPSDTPPHGAAKSVFDEILQNKEHLWDML